MAFRTAEAGGAEWTPPPDPPPPDAGGSPEPAPAPAADSPAARGAGCGHQPRPPPAPGWEGLQPTSPTGGMLFSIADCDALARFLEAPLPQGSTARLQQWLAGVGASPPNKKLPRGRPAQGGGLQPPPRVGRTPRRPATGAPRRGTVAPPPPVPESHSASVAAAALAAAATTVASEGGTATPQLRGYDRFRAALSAALFSSHGEDLHERWDNIAELLERGGADPAGKEAAKVTEKEMTTTGNTAATYTQEAAVSVCGLLEALLCRLWGLQPALRSAITFVRRRMLAVAFTQPIVAVPFSGSDARAMKAAARSLRKSLKDAQRLQVGPDSGPRHAMGSAGMLERFVTGGRSRRYLVDQGVAGLLDDAITSLVRDLPGSACGFLAAYFVEKMSAVRVELADTRHVFEQGSVYFSRQESLAPAVGKESVAESLISVVQRATGFINFHNFRVSDGRRYSAASLHRHLMYPTAKRLAVTFLELLGRVKDRGQKISTRSDGRDLLHDWVYHVPAIQISPELHARNDNSTELALNAASVDRTGKRAPVDEVYWHHCPTGNVSGPDARDIYGGGEFRITIGELKELELSARVACSEGMPPRFFTELAALTTKRDNTWFFSLCRATPLEKLGDESVWDHLLEVAETRHQTERLSVHKLEDQRAELMRNINFSVDPPIWITGATVPGAPSRNPLDVLAEHDFDLHQRKLWRDSSQAYAEYLKRRPAMRELAKQTAVWLDRVKSRPVEYGFDSVDDLSQLLKQSLTEMCTLVALSQRGYYFVDGEAGNANQLAPKTPKPVVFISAAGLDFNTPSTTVLEAQKYFQRQQTRSGVPEHQQFRGFLPDGQAKMLGRLRDLYTVILESCFYNNVRNPSMLALGLGVFLLNIDNSDRQKVQELYFRAQYQLLSERDWGFECYYINPGGLGRLAREVLEDGITKGDYNNPGQGRFFRCNIVIHQKDTKFVAIELAKNCADPAVLVPSDCASVCLGQIGYHWETGRAGYYVGEEDLASTSTVLLAHVGISDTLTNIGRCIEVGKGAGRGGAGGEAGPGSPRGQRPRPNFSGSSASLRFQSSVKALKSKLRPPVSSSIGSLGSLCVSRSPSDANLPVISTTLPSPGSPAD